MTRLYSLIAATMLTVATAMAQVVTTEPTIVQRSSSPIVVTFHADRGNRGLAGLNGSAEVYAHTGVIMAGSDTWQKAPAWLDNADKYRLTYVANDTWQLTIPSIDTYFGTKSTDDVVRLAFVFRNANGTREAKEANGSDIFIDVRPDGFTLELTGSPQKQLLSAPTEVTLTAYTTAPAEITIYRDGADMQMVAMANDATKCQATVTVSDTGDNKFTAVAVSDSGDISSESITYTLVGSSPTADYPGGTPKMGPVKNADGSVTFCIAAPNKDTVMIVGSWDDYAYSTAQVMNRQVYQGNAYFWITIPDIADGNDYIYWFIVDNTIQVGDPYARLVLDPRYDKYIPDYVFPDMPQYPSAKVDGVPVAVYNSAADDYDWQVTDFKGVDQSQLLIYELLIRDFTGTEGQSYGDGTIAGLMTKLDYLQDLGVNAIELLPIMEFNGNNSWGYNTNFYFAPDKAYGTPDDYRRLIDEIHRRDMAVILDIVFNQSDGMHPWYQMYDIRTNPFYNGSAPHAYSVLNDWNQDNPIVQQQWRDALEYWMKAYHVDGFRFDLVKGLGTNQSYNATYVASSNTWTGVTDAKTNAYNASRVERMRELHEAMRTVNPDAYFINENLAGPQEENQMAEDGEINWANINDAAAQFAMGYQSNLNRFFAPADSRTWGSTVSYAESHDEERIAYRVSRDGASSIRNNNSMTMRRLGSLAAQMLMTPGAHMIWQFEEFGANQTTKESGGGNDTSSKKVVWSLLDKAANAGLKNTYRSLFILRRDNPEMFTEDVNVTLGCNAANWTQGRYISLVNGRSGLFLAVNPQISGSLTIPLVNVPLCVELQLMCASYGTKPTIEGTRVTLPAGAFAIYGTADLTDVPTITDDTHSIYVYSADHMIHVEGTDTYSVYDLAGRIVDASRPLQSGIYIVATPEQSYKVAVN